MKIGAIIQARMSSSRLPDKVLRDVEGKPLLQYVLERIEHCTGLDAVIVATSDDPSDDPIARFSERRGTPCFRGDLANVADRYLRAAEAHGLDAFVRVTGDSPLIDPRLVDRAVSRYRDGEYDLVTNVMPRTYPRGQSVEVLRTETFRRACARMTEADEREHVTLYLHRHPEEFRVSAFTLEENLNHIQLSVDDWQDMATFTTIIRTMDRPHWEYGLDALLDLRRRAAPGETKVTE